MNKQLAQKGTTLNKNMTNTESLTVSDLTVTEKLLASDDATIQFKSLNVTDEASIFFVNALSISTPELELAAACSAPTLPTVVPSGNAKEGDIYFTHDDQTNDNVLHICDSHNWIHIDLN